MSERFAVRFATRIHQVGNIKSRCFRIACSFLCLINWKRKPRRLEDKDGRRARYSRSPTVHVLFLPREGPVATPDVCLTARLHRALSACKLSKARSPYAAYIPGVLLSSLLHSTNLFIIGVIRRIRFKTIHLVLGVMKYHKLFFLLILIFKWTCRSKYANLQNQELKISKWNLHASLKRSTRFIHCKFWRVNLSLIVFYSLLPNRAERQRRKHKQHNPT